MTRLELRLPQTAEAPWIARRSLAERFAEELERRELEDATLLTSELVTNAVIHGRGPIALSALLDGDRLRVNVTDEGGGFDRTPREPGLDAVGGYGLDIVDELATRWGMHERTSHVWFELECARQGRDRRKHCPQNGSLRRASQRPAGNLNRRRAGQALSFL